MSLNKGLSLTFVLALAACASSSDLTAQYNRGMKAARKDDWDTAMKELGQFVAESCPLAKPERRCRAAYLTIARGHERAGTFQKAWTAYDRVLMLPPQGKVDPQDDPAAVAESLQRVQAQLLEKLGQSSDRGPVLVRYRDEVPDEFSLRSVTVTIDFEPRVTRDKNAGELHSPDFAQVFAGPLPAGGHVLTIDSVHSCKPNQDAPCAPSKFHRSYDFASLPHEPTTIEVRAYADPGEDGKPAKPTAAFTTR
jgi:hypothetical protein